MSTTAPAATAPQALSDAERDACLEALHRDGYCLLPHPLPADTVRAVREAIDRVSAMERANPTPGVVGNPGRGGLCPVKVSNCVDRDPAFRALMVHVPALQLCHDVFGPMFHLNQSNFVSRPPDDSKPRTDFLSATGWHADGPRPRLFPQVGGVMGLHYLKFGFFVTDVLCNEDGALQVVRGSHRRPELDGMKDGSFDIARYKADVVDLLISAGTVFAFHQAQWHAAAAVTGTRERKNVYISYCPTWMRPFDRDCPASEASLAGCTREERWLLGEPRPAQRFWLPREDDAQRMARFVRTGTPSRWCNAFYQAETGKYEV